MKGVQPPYFCKQNRRHSLPVVQKQPSLTAKMVKRYLSFLAIMDGLKKKIDGAQPPLANKINRTDSLVQT